MRRMLVAGNWKMNGSLESIKSLLNGIKSGLANSTVAGDVAVCPPSVYLAYVADQIKGSNIQLGGQNVCDQDSGAYTGEISSSMLSELGCQYALVGHSERRSLYGESDKLVAQRFAAARRGKLTPILCVGEQLEDREAGQTEAVVSRQLDAVIELEGIEALGDGVIAYEPVWAIGTGKTATPMQAQEIHAFIRGRLAEQNTDVAQKVIIQYGGSVKPNNAKELFSQPDIDGGLIGGASLNADDFVAICKAAEV